MPSRLSISCIVVVCLRCCAVDAGEARSLYVSTLEPSEKVAAQLSDVLADGFNRRISLETFRSEVRNLPLEMSNDPAVTYAFALSLIKRSEYDTGLAALMKLRGTGEASYFPAWRASIWLLLTRKRFDEGFRDVRKLAEMLNDPDVQWNSPAVPLENFRWIGSLLVGLDLDLVGSKERALHSQIFVDLETKSTPANRRAFQMGVNDALEQQSELESKLSGVREQVLESVKENARLEQADLDDKKLLAEKKKEELKLTAEEWKKKLDAALLEFSKRLGERQREYSLLDAKRQALARSIDSLQQQLVILQSVTPPRSNQNTGFPDPAEQSLILEINLRQQQLLACQSEQTQTLAALEQVRVQGNQILAERAAMIQDYQAATGRLVKEDKEIDKAAQKFAEREEELKSGHLEANSRETRKLEQQIKSFETYISFDLNSERQRLIDAHSPSSATSSETTP